jgi:protein-L-isoaspartate(D-aspartate) O-methyltransferase
MNIELARRTMIQQHIRPWGVLDPEVLDSLSMVKREQFVPPTSRHLAFADVEIPLPCGQQMLAPKIEARILQAAAPPAHARVLEVGAGSGYMAALLARRAQTVLAIEIHDELCGLAQRNLRANGQSNVEVTHGNGAHGWPPRAPYDVIVVSGGLPVLSPALLAQLTVGGRLCAFVGAAPIMEAQRIARINETEYRTEALFETWVEPLEGVAYTPEFQF